MGNRIGKAYNENNPPTVTFDEPNGAVFFLCPDETVLPPYTNPCPQIEVVVSETPVEYNDCVPCDAITQALIANYIENGPFPSAFTLNIPGVFENYVTSLAQLQNLCNFTFQVDGNNAPTIDFAVENGAAYYLCPSETVLPPFTEQITAVSGCLPCQDIEQALKTYYLENGSNAAPPTLNALYGVSPELAELNIDFSTYSSICGFTVDFDSNNIPIATWTNPTPSTSYFCLGTYTKAPDAENMAYRYGFNGMEKDDEVKGKGKSYDFGARMYDSRLGRFLSVDPLASNFSFKSPYDFAENDVIRCIDLDGAEKFKKTGNNKLNVIFTLGVITSGTSSHLERNHEAIINTLDYLKVEEELREKYSKQTIEIPAKLAKYIGFNNLQVDKKGNVSLQVEFTVNLIDAKDGEGFFDKEKPENYMLIHKGVMKDLARREGFYIILNKDAFVSGKSNEDLSTYITNFYNNSMKKEDQIVKTSPGSVIAHEAGHGLLDRGDDGHSTKGILSGEQESIKIDEKNIIEMIIENKDRIKKQINN